MCRDAAGQFLTLGKNLSQKVITSAMPIKMTSRKIVNFIQNSFTVICFTSRSVFSTFALAVWFLSAIELTTARYSTRFC